MAKIVGMSTCVRALVRWNNAMAMGIKQNCLSEWKGSPLKRKINSCPWGAGDIFHLNVPTGPSVQLAVCLSFRAYFGDEKHTRLGDERSGRGQTRDQKLECHTQFDQKTLPHSHSNVGLCHQKTSLDGMIVRGREVVASWRTLGANKKILHFLNFGDSFSAQHVG